MLIDFGLFLLVLYCNFGFTSYIRPLDAYCPREYLWARLTVIAQSLLCRRIGQINIWLFVHVRFT